MQAGYWFGVARQLANRGASIILNDIDEIRAKLAAEINQFVVLVMTPVPGDAADLGVVQQIIRKRWINTAN